MLYELLVGGILGITVFSLLVSVPLYVLVLTAVATNRNVEPFNSEFFTIFVWLGSVDITCYLLYLGKKLIFLGYVPSFLMPFNQPNIYCAIFYYPFWAFAFFQYQLTFIMTLNRHFSIVLPGFYMQNWTTKRTKQLIYMCIIISCVISLPIFNANCQISEYMAFREEKPRTLRYGPYIVDKKIDKYFKSLWAVHVYGLVISSIAFYGMMIKKLRENKMIVSHKRRRVELQLFYLGFAVFLLNLAFTIYFLLRDLILIRLTTNSHVHEWILYFYADIYDLPNGYILWFTSARVRRIVWNWLKGNGLGNSENLVFSFLSSKHTARVSGQTDEQHSPVTLTSRF